METLRPNRDWGDNGLLGMELGEGVIDDFRSISNKTEAMKNDPTMKEDLEKVERRWTEK